MGLGMACLCLAAPSSAAERAPGEAASAVVAVLAIVVALAVADHCRFVQQAKHEEPSSADFHLRNESYHFPFSLAAVADAP